MQWLLKETSTPLMCYSLRQEWRIKLVLLGGLSSCIFTSLLETWSQVSLIMTKLVLDLRIKAYNKMKERTQLWQPKMFVQKNLYLLNTHAAYLANHLSTLTQFIFYKHYITNCYYFSRYKKQMKTYAKWDPVWHCVQ